jgi:hypothetical protein
MFFTVLTASLAQEVSAEMEKMGVKASTAARSHAPSYKVEWKITVFFPPVAGFSSDHKKNQKYIGKTN